MLYAEFRMAQPVVCVFQHEQAIAEATRLRRDMSLFVVCAGQPAMFTYFDGECFIAALGNAYLNVVQGQKGVKLHETKMDRSRPRQDAGL